MREMKKEAEARWREGEGGVRVGGDLAETKQGRERGDRGDREGDRRRGRDQERGEGDREMNRARGNGARGSESDRARVRKGWGSQDLLLGGKGEGALLRVHSWCLSGSHCTPPLSHI